MAQLGDMTVNLTVEVDTKAAKLLMRILETTQKQANDLIELAGYVGVKVESRESTDDDNIQP
ncbi:hypothetical protein AGMMS49992_11160 [Clostridia bacterium]|nr:hypothetical protein AGMMS49992_11160 [Clostridia bacterium]